MKVKGAPYKSILATADKRAVNIVDQTKLPHEFSILRLGTIQQIASAKFPRCKSVAPPPIGATAAYGMALAMREDPSDGSLACAFSLLNETSPTAINLRWALEQMKEALTSLPLTQREARA